MFRVLVSGVRDFSPQIFGQPELPFPRKSIYSHVRDYTCRCLHTTCESWSSCIFFSGFNSNSCRHPIVNQILHVFGGMSPTMVSQYFENHDRPMIEVPERPINLSLEFELELSQHRQHFCRLGETHRWRGGLRYPRHRIPPANFFG